MSNFQNEQANRPVANFNSSIWGDLFLNYSPLSHQETVKEDVKRELSEKVEEQFRILLSSYESNQLGLLTLIDTVQRLGVAYRFSSLIQQSLQAIFELSTSITNGDLHLTALRFRLLRQHGYYVSTDVFGTLLEEARLKMSSLSSSDDVQGILSLYEASHLRVDGEYILDEALEFTRIHLESLDTNNLQVARSLSIPLHKAMVRIESRHFISIYQQDPAHNRPLLQFAKMEFNFLQSIYRQELKHLSRWWEDLKLALKLPFVVRDRVVELYFWGLGALYEHQHSFTRIIFTKTVKLISILDDIYDAYGVIHELEPFHRAIQRWDISCAEQLPQFMKLVLGAFIDTYKEIEQSLVKEGRSHLIRYVIQETKDMSRAYLREARWRQEKYTPTFDEYMNEAAILSFGDRWAMAICFVGIGDEATEDAFEWLHGNPVVVEGGGKNGRLMNDMVSRKFERNRWHIPSAVECYMKENGAMKEETHKEFHEQIECVWKDMNKAMLRPTVVPRTLLELQLNFDRVVNLIYKHGDGYTFPEKNMKDHVSLVLLNPIP